MAGKASLSAQNFSQTLHWNADPNVLEYKIEVQDSTGKIIKSITTEESSVKLSLEQGTYKYKITAYDLLGRESVSTKWTAFEVLVAKQPTIEHKKEKESLKEDGKTLDLNVNVDDVTADTVAELVNTATGEKIAGKLIIEPAAGAPAAGLSASETHKANKAQFSDVPEGNWKLVVTNPSGLSSESENFEVKDTYKEKRIAAAKAEEERIAREKAKREEEARIAREKAEAEEAERKRQEELRIQREEEERLAREEQERLERERAEQERLALEEQKRLEQERLAEEERLERERIAELERLERERLEQERLAREEEERLAREEEERIAKEEEKKRKHEAWLNKDRKFSIMPGAGIALVAYDDDFFNYYMEKNFFNPAIDLKIGFLPLHTNRMRFGMELDAMATRFNSNTEYYNLDLNALTLQENLAIRFASKNKKIWLQIKGGGGVSLIQEVLDYYENTQNNRESKTQLFGYFIAGGGLSVIITPAAMTMLELGVDYYNLFIPDMNIGIINPYLAIGLRF